VASDHGTQLLQGFKVNVVPINAIVNDKGLIVGKLDWGEPGQLQGRSINDAGEILDDDGNVIGHVDGLGKALRPEELALDSSPAMDKLEAPLPSISVLDGLKVTVNDRILGAMDLNSRGAIVNDEGEIMAELSYGDPKACTGITPDENGNILGTDGTIIGKVTFLSTGEGVWHEREATLNAREGESSTPKLFMDATRNLQDLLATHAFDGELNNAAIGLDDALLRMKLWASEMDVDEVVMDSLSARSPYLAMADQMLLRVVLVNTRRLDALLAEADPPAGAEEVVYRLARKIDRAAADLTKDLAPYKHLRDLDEGRGPATAMRERLKLYEEQRLKEDVDATARNEPSSADDGPKQATTRSRSASAARAVPARDTGVNDDATSQRPIRPADNDNDPSPGAHILDADGNRLDLHEFVRTLQHNNEILLRWVQDRGVGP
jgi:hypothetical protein